MGGLHEGIDEVGALSNMEQYDVASGQWCPAAATRIARVGFGARVIAGEPYVTGGKDAANTTFASVENKHTLERHLECCCPHAS